MTGKKLLINRPDRGEGDHLSFILYFRFEKMTDEEYEQEQKLACYSKLHSEEYAQKAAEANSYGNKKLYINEKNELVIIDALDINMKKEGAHYRGRRSLEELIKQVKKIRDHYNITRSGLVEKSSIISCLDE